MIMNNQDPTLNPSEDVKTVSRIWDGVHKSNRYLSDWDDDAIVIDTQSHGNSRSEPATFRLSEMHIVPTGDLSVYPETPISLTAFPEFCRTLKYTINSAIRNKKFNVRDHVAKIINHNLRFFSFCVSNGVYRLNDVSRDLTAAYQQRVLQLGWWNANEYDKHLHRFLSKLENDESLQKSVLRERRGNRTFHLNIENIQKITGLRFSNSALPSWFYEKFREITKTPRLPYKSSTTENEPSLEASKSAFESINYMCFTHECFDAIRFIAFPKVAKTCADYFKSKQQDKRTKTLSLETSITIISESLKWIYDYGPSLVPVLNDIRAELESPTRGNQDVVRRAKKANHAFGAALEKIRQKHQISIPELRTDVAPATKFRILTNTLTTAAFFIIAATTARRRREITGEGRTYGLYFGCLQKVHSEAEDCKVEFYIEKSLQDYDEFWAPKVCIDSINILEELSQVHRPLKSERKPLAQELAIARLDKLFVTRSFQARAPFISAQGEFDINSHGAHFFQLCGVDPKEMFNRNKSIFRRFYCNIFVNRYDNPVAAALQQHLDHSHMGITAIYGLDSHNRAAEEKASTLLRRSDDDDESFYAIMREASQAHHVAKIEDLLNGLPVGGHYSRLILKLAARLSKDASFAVAPIETKANILAAKMQNRGFASFENGHGMCMAGKARHTQKKANCFRDGTVHQEDASPNVCQGCINLMSPEGYQRHLANERDALLTDATDMTLPRALREAKKKDGEAIDAFIEADRKVAEGNQQLIANLVHSWVQLQEETDL